LTSTTEKRLSLHRRLTRRQEQNDALRRRIEQLQPLANIGTAAFMIAHEINNLLTPVSSYAALALSNPDDRALSAKALQKAVGNCDRTAKIMESMLALANGEKQERAETRLAGLIDEIFICLGRDFSKDGITVQIQVPKQLTIWAVPVQIQHVLMNLILNAREAMLASGGVLTIKAVDAPDTICIEVRDTGCGIEPGDLDDVFKSFFTTKTTADSPPQRQGCGLGLAFCRQVVDAHNGLISVESKPKVGTTFTITLPKPQQAYG